MAWLGKFVKKTQIAIGKAKKPKPPLVGRVRCQLCDEWVVDEPHHMIAHACECEGIKRL